MPRTPIIAGNWKMFKTQEEAVSFLSELAGLTKGCAPEVFLGVPFTAISKAAHKAKGTHIRVGAQNMHDALEGAFTGEISAPMLKDAGATFVILGHSERRNIFNESDAFINRKVKRALHESLLAILCIGELEAEREEGKTEAVLEKQLSGALQEVRPEELRHLVIAYEPVWAIGTGKTATPQIAEEAHAFIRSYLQERFGRDAASAMRILYGGSVKPENIQELMSMPNIDGALVGGASLKAPTFAKIVTYQ